ncbi:MAG: hypothetical protein IJI14_18765 [Anaerolineaceae bacterium]|nr:hypothetical protein [Anaerolineaceae bacterium]
MANFRTLLGFELKKMFFNKITIILLILFAGFLFGITMLEYIVISPEDQFVSRREAELEGKPLDEEMMSRIFEESARYGGLAELNGSSIYYHIARYVNRAQGAYLDIADISASYNSPDTLTAEKFYQNREELLNYLHDYFHLTDDEKSYWNSREAKIEKPFIWQANYGVSSMKANFGMLTALAALTIGISVSGIFASESRFRTDSLIQCTRKGTKTLPFVKILSGELFSLIVGILLLAAVQLPHIFFNGFDGFETVCQLITPFSSYRCTSGELVLIFTGVYILAILLLGAVTAFLSLMMNSTIAAGGFVCITILLDLFLTIPPKLRILSQIRFLTPIQVLINSSMMDPRLVRIGSSWLTNFQTSACLYAILIVIFSCSTLLLCRKNRRS